MQTPNTAINQRYRLEEEIGRGGMGVIYRARDTLLDRPVAVKILHTAGLDNQVRSNLLREAQIIARLSHPNIITVYDAGETPEAPYLVMELIDGRPLEALIPLAIDQIYPFINQICSALEYAHQQGIIHRDLKPGNILVDQNGRYMLMDFGLARSAAARLTVEGVISGTVHYMSPEQALGKAVDARSDLYSLGIMLYELATGGVPFSGDNPLAIITQHLYAPVVPPNLKNEAIPSALNDLIVGLLNKDPADRPASAAEVIEKIHRKSGDQPSAARVEEQASILDRIVRGRMVARQAEMAEVDRLWQRARCGDGQVLLVSGEPGIGKTRLVQEMLTRAGVNGGLTLVGESYAEGGAPYAPFAQIARAALLRQPVLADLPEYILADLLMLAPDLRQRYPTVQPNPSLDPKAEQARLVENMLAWCQLLCEQQPLLIVLEDAHWADSSSLNLFHQLARRARRLPILFVLTYREVELDAWLPMQGLLVELNRERIGTNLKLKRLDEGETKAMLASLFAEEITPEFLTGIYQTTEGNPFFIEEVCRALVETGEVYFRDGRWQRPAMEAIQIPQSVRLAIQSRFKKLPADVQELVRLAATIGREFGLDILQAASDFDESRLIDAIEAAENYQFIQPAGAPDRLAYRFSHALFPATLVEGIHTLRRRRIHRKIAEGLQRLHPDQYEALAYHYTEGGDDRQAYTYHIKAGRKAAAAFANAEAETHFQAALALAEMESDKASLLLELGDVRLLLGQFQEAKGDYLAAAAINLDQHNLDGAAMGYRNAARAAWDGGDPVGSLQLARQGLERISGLQAGRGLASLLTETGRGIYFAGQNREEGIRYVRQAMEIAERENYPDVLCDSLINLAVLLDWKRENFELMERAVQIAEENGYYSQLARGLNNLGTGYELITGEYQKVVAAAERGIEAARRHNDPMQEINFLGLAVDAEAELGHFAIAKERLQKAHHIPEVAPSKSFYWNNLHANEAQLLLYTGQLEAAQQMMEIMRKSCLEAQDLQMILVSDYMLAQIYLQQQQYGFARSALAEGIEAGSNLMPLFEPAMSWLLVKALCREGLVEEAAGALQRLTSRKYMPLAPHYLEIPLKLATAELAVMQGNWETAWSAYAEAVDRLHSMGLPFREAQALDDWAAGLVRRGQPEDLRASRQLLQQSLEIYTRIDAAYYADQARQRLKQIQP